MSKCTESRIYVLTLFYFLFFDFFSGTDSAYFIRYRMRVSSIVFLCIHTISLVYYELCGGPYFSVLFCFFFCYYTRNFASLFSSSFAYFVQHFYYIIILFLFFFYFYYYDLLFVLTKPNGIILLCRRLCRFALRHQVR